MLRLFRIVWGWEPRKPPYLVFEPMDPLVRAALEEAKNIQWAKESVEAQVEPAEPAEEPDKKIVPLPRRRSARE